MAQTGSVCVGGEGGGAQASLCVHSLASAFAVCTYFNMEKAKEFNQSEQMHMDIKISLQWSKSNIITRHDSFVVSFMFFFIT